MQPQQQQVLAADEHEPRGKKPTGKAPAAAAAVEDRSTAGRMSYAAAVSAGWRTLQAGTSPSLLSYPNVCSTNSNTSSTGAAADEASCASIPITNDITADAQQDAVGADAAAATESRSGADAAAPLLLAPPADCNVSPLGGNAAAGNSSTNAGRGAAAAAAAASLSSIQPAATSLKPSQLQADQVGHVIMEVEDPAEHSSTQPPGQLLLIAHMQKPPAATACIQPPATGTAAAAEVSEHAADQQAGRNAAVTGTAAAAAAAAAGDGAAFELRAASAGQLHSAAACGASDGSSKKTLVRPLANTNQAINRRQQAAAGGAAATSSSRQHLSRSSSTNTGRGTSSSSINSRASRPRPVRTHPSRQQQQQCSSSSTLLQPPLQPPVLPFVPAVPLAAPLVLPPTPTTPAFMVTGPFGYPVPALMGLDMPALAARMGPLGPVGLAGGFMPPPPNPPPAFLHTKPTAPARFPAEAPALLPMPPSFGPQHAGSWMGLGPTPPQSFMLQQQRMQQHLAQQQGWFSSQQQQQQQQASSTAGMIPRPPARPRAPRSSVRPARPAAARLDGVDVRPLMHFCHMSFARRQLPQLDRAIVKQLVRAQVRAAAPILPHWYRHGDAGGPLSRSSSQADVEGGSSRSRNGSGSRSSSGTRSEAGSGHEGGSMEGQEAHVTERHHNSTTGAKDTAAAAAAATTRVAAAHGSTTSSRDANAAQLAHPGQPAATGDTAASILAEQRPRHRGPSTAGQSRLNPAAKPFTLRPQAASPAPDAAVTDSHGKATGQNSAAAAAAAVVHSPGAATVPPLGSAPADTAAARDQADGCSASAVTACKLSQRSSSSTKATGSKGHADHSKVELLTVPEFLHDHAAPAAAAAAAAALPSASAPSSSATAASSGSAVVSAGSHSTLSSRTGLTATAEAAAAPAPPPPPSAASVEPVASGAAPTRKHDNAMPVNIGSRHSSRASMSRSSSGGSGSGGSSSSGLSAGCHHRSSTGVFLPRYE